MISQINFKITSLLRPEIGFYRTEKCLRVYVSHLGMGFLDAGMKNIKDSIGDCVTFHRLPSSHLFLGSYFDATLSTGMAHGTNTL